MSGAGEAETTMSLWKLILLIAAIVAIVVAVVWPEVRGIADIREDPEERD